MDFPKQIRPRPNVAAIRISALLPILEHLAQDNAKTDEFLGRFGISQSNLSDPYALIPLSTYVQLFEAAAAQTREANIGLQLGMQIRPADLGPIGVLYSLSPTIRNAYERISRDVMALQGGTQSTLFEVGSDYIWTYRVIDPEIWPRRQDAEYTIATMCQLTRSCFNSNWRPVEIHFEHDQPSDNTLAQRSLRAPVVYNESANRIIFERTQANKIHRQEDRGLSLILKRHIGDLLGETRGQDNVADQVRKRVAAYIGQRALTVDTLASELRMSPRSLQRKLAEEGTSLREILKAHRMELARLALTQDKLDLAALAVTLGYADGTVLWRAFRGWTGSDPRSYRRAQTNPPDTANDADDYGSDL